MFIITIDGPAGAGKGTIAQNMAKKFDFHHIDTGLYYRALAKKIIDNHIDVKDIKKIIPLARDIKPEDTKQLREEHVAAIASQIAVIPDVRALLTECIRRYVLTLKDCKGIVLDGRDAGTVIFPEAQCKLFVTANPQARALRRLKEIEKTTEFSQNKIERYLEERDQRDSSREISPLKAADDAFILDTSDLTIDEACSNAASYISSCCSKVA
ncbi:MAG: (d)CMP kinase [Proteobacteria bacterium]|nr:(d)CMP kinase [Pseudomonadota bacterium]